jgi:hypothetical protein
LSAPAVAPVAPPRPDKGLSPLARAAIVADGESTVSDVTH